jgi:hypothetical protein
MKRTFLLGCFLLIFGCATPMNQVPQGPEPYRTGYQHGCNSGNVAAGHPYYRFTKDVNRYSSDQDYKQGWDDGFNVCKGKYESIQRMMQR